MKVEEIAQWVIDNRYSKNENDKVSDSELYYILIDKINSIGKMSEDEISIMARENANKELDRNKDLTKEYFKNTLKNTFIKGYKAK